MNEQGLLVTVGLARDRLGELRGRLGEQGVALGPVEVDGTLRELEGMLDTLRARWTILREILECTSDIHFAKDVAGRYVMIDSKRAGLLGTSLTEIPDQDGTALLEPATGRQQRLRALAAEIVIAEECLRQALVSDLQKRLGQDIALARLKLAALRGDSAAGLSGPLLQIEHLVEQADRSLRSVTYQFIPPSLQDLGLLPALQWLADDISTRYGFEVRVEELGSPAPLDGRMRAILFRAVRELVLNAARHARAHEVRIQLDTAAGRLCVRVEDDGCGFDGSRVELEGYGLCGIREQLTPVGGSLELDTAPGRGTKVTLLAPFDFVIQIAS